MTKMKSYYLPFLTILIGLLVSCQPSTNSGENAVSQDSLVMAEESKVLAIDILLDPDQVMLDRSKEYNDRMRVNFPEGFELDESHRPHITVIQAFVREVDLSKIEDKIRKIISTNSLQGQNLLANGMYYIPYDGKGLAGITVEKEPLMSFHQQIVSMMEAYTVPEGTGEAFVPRPDGEPIMEGTVDYVNAFVQMASREKFNPHVTIGTADEAFVKGIVEEPFKSFEFKVNSVSIYQLGELGTAQKKLASLPFQ